MKLLIIDDEADIRLILRVSLRQRGLAIVEAAGGRDGVRVARAERPDAILLDVMMPELDGPTTLDALRRDPATAAIPVVFLTAKGTTADLDRLRALGAAGVIVKPFNPLTLADQIDAVLHPR